MALEYLHEHDILYLDLTPANVLLTDAGHVKLVEPTFMNGLRSLGADLTKKRSYGTPGCKFAREN